VRLSGINEVLSAAISELTEAFPIPRDIKVGGKKYRVIAWQSFEKYQRQRGAGPAATVDPSGKPFYLGWVTLVTPRGKEIQAYLKRDKKELAMPGKHGSLMGVPFTKQ